MKGVSINIWVKFEDLYEFNRDWDELFSSEMWYHTHKFQRKRLKLYTEKMMGNFVQLQLPLKKYLFYLEKTK